MANIDKAALVHNGKVVGAGRNKDNSNLAPIEATTTASRSYLVGDYLMLQGEFYKVISAISIGDTLTVGTNIQSTNVGDEIVDIKDRLDTHSLGSRIEITSYNTSSNKYTFNSEGYVLVRSGNAADNNTQFNISSGFTILSRCYKAGVYEDNYVFMKKGMSGYVNSMTGSGAVYFIPLS